MVSCNRCRAENPEDAKYCQECGSVLEGDTKNSKIENQFKVKTVPDLNPFWWVFLSVFITPLVVILIGLYYVARKRLGAWLIVGYGCVGLIVYIIILFLLFMNGVLG